MIHIIGAGPSGSHTAQLLSKHQDVTLYEEHKTIGKPVQCTGIVTSKINDLIKIPHNIIVNKITRAQIITNKKLEINFKTPNLILNRTLFDQHLANKAIDNGTKLITKKIKKPFKETTIFADGPLTIAPFKQKTKFFFTKQSIIKGNFESDLVKFYPINQGFAWIVPESDKIARIGVATLNNPKTTHNILTKNKTILENQSGLIPLFNPKQIIQQNNQYLIGDAAGFVKATTGGGIIQGLQSAINLNESIKEQKNYTKLCKKTLYKDLYSGLLARKIMNKLNYKDHQKIIKLTSQKRIKKTLSTTDRDEFIKLSTKMLIKEPRYLQFIPKILINSLKNS